jgi:hypothetical protein
MPVTDPSQLTGLALRAAVAVEVMGWQLTETELSEEVWMQPDGLITYCDPPPWESDRTAAQQVVDAIGYMGLMHRLCYFLLIESGI